MDSLQIETVSDRHLIVFGIDELEHDPESCRLFDKIMRQNKESETMNRFILKRSWSREALTYVDFRKIAVAPSPFCLFLVSSYFLGELLDAEAISFNYLRNKALSLSVNLFSSRMLDRQRRMAID